MSHKRPRLEVIDDDEIMERLLAHLPSIRTMNTEINRIIESIPTVSRDVSHQGPASSFEMPVDSSQPFMDLRMFNEASNKRFRTASVRHLYEIMTAGYLNEIKKMDKNIIDFDVYINDALKLNFLHESEGNDTEEEGDSDDDMSGKEKIPYELSSVVSSWADILKEKDIVFKKALRNGDTSDKIVRRGLLLSFEAHFYSPTVVGGNREVKQAGHMLLLVMEVTGANRCNFYLVDNVTNGWYVQSIHQWISTVINTAFTSLFTDLNIALSKTIMNQQPLHELRGVCMSTAFRAMLLIALLKDPWKRIENQAEDIKTEARHIFKFMYYQMDSLDVQGLYLQGNEVLH